MVQALFCLNVLAVIGMLAMPLTASTRMRALYDWLVQLLAAGVFAYLIETYYPSWEEPYWHTTTAWAVTTWILFALGFIVAICKPRKRSLPVA